MIGLCALREAAGVTDLFAPAKRAQVHTMEALCERALQSGAVTLSVETSVQAEMVQVVKGFVMLFATINILRYLLQSRKKGVKAV